LVILFISLFITLCVTLDPGTHKDMHSVLDLKLGVTQIPKAHTPDNATVPVRNACANRCYNDE
jgi:hypothetical protein